MFAMIKVILCITCIISMVLETTTENAAPCFQKESKKRIRDSNSTTSLDSEKVEEKEGNSTNLELPKVDSAQTAKNVPEETTTEKEILSTIHLLNSEITKEEGNSSEKYPSTVTESLNSVNTDKAENPDGKLEIVTKLSIDKKEETIQEDSTKKEENSTLKDLPPVGNLTESESAKKEESISIETTIKDTQQSSTEKLEPIKARRQIDNENDEDKVKNERAFLKAYKNCKLIVGEHFLRMSDKNPEKTRKCVVTELQKLESYDGEYTKLLDNSKIIRRL